MGHRMPTVLLVGGSGFIGKSLSKQLTKTHKVIIVDLAQYTPESETQVISANINSPQELEQVFETTRPDIVIHLAAYINYTPDLAQSYETMTTNVSGTLLLLELSTKYKTKLFINTSTCFVYDNHLDKADETSRTNPKSLYSKSKLLAESLCDYYATRNNLAVITFRLYPPYGDFDRQTRFLPTLIRNTYLQQTMNASSGFQTWDYIHVRDIVRAYELAIDRKEMFSGTHEIFNLGCGESISLRDLSATIAKKLDKGEIVCWGVNSDRSTENKFYCADISKAQAVLNWKPYFRLKTNGLDDVIEKIISELK